MALRLSSLPFPLLWHCSCSTLTPILVCPTYTSSHPSRAFARICWTAGNSVRPWLQSVDRHLGLLLFRHRPASHPWFLTAEPQHRTFAGLDARDSGVVVGVSMSASCAWSIYFDRNRRSRARDRTRERTKNQRQKQPAVDRETEIGIRNTSPKQKRKAPPTPKTAHLHTN
jgi:hypothetical protein